MLARYDDVVHILVVVIVGGATAAIGVNTVDSPLAVSAAIAGVDGLWEGG